MSFVALLAEGVDRNIQFFILFTAFSVALLAEGVDRNHDYFTSCLPYPVALLAEGVDRNIKGIIGGVNRMMSPSSRRAWIEILALRLPRRCKAVALLAEGVDRNSELPFWKYAHSWSRPPRGGRG